jgi:hypothetical protein
MTLTIVHRVTPIFSGSPSHMSTDKYTAPAPASDHEMSDQEILSDNASNSTGTTSDRHSDYILWDEVETIQILHEANLQDLLKAKNNVVLHLLQERNALLRER